MANNVAIADGTVSELMVLRSAAGYYIGTQIYDGEFGCWMPNNRNSVEYYHYEEEAQVALDNKSYTVRNWF